MIMKFQLITLSILLATGVAVAQDATTTPTTTKPASVNARRERQQKRIGEGVENGSLTAGETAKLESKETKLAKEEARMKKSGGQLTPAEKAKLEKQENKLSKDIAAQKHDAQVQNTAPKSEIEKRDREQQKRIGEGIENGSLNSREAAKLETKDAKIQRQERKVRADGQVTPQEKARINREQNKESKAIYRQKHDKQHRRG